jgi:DNA-binding response OmpR family regulator
VDDDEDLVELLVEAFEKDGRFEIRTANNGFGAGMLVKEFRPDLVVLDVMLPDINGKEVCQRVRSDSNLDAVKIICISGMVEQDKVADLKAAGANDFLQKPFSVDKLLDRACSLLEIERATVG